MAKRRIPRKSASRQLTIPGKAYKLHGEGGRGRPKGARRGAPLLGPLMSRLRRLEVIMLHLTGRLKLEPDLVEQLLDNIQELREDTKDLGGKSGNSEV